MMLYARKTVEQITAPLARITKQLRDHALAQRTQASASRESAAQFAAEAELCEGEASKADAAAANIERLLGA